MVGTTAFIFVAFVVRAAHMLMQLVATVQGVEEKCYSCDASCSDGTLFLVWIDGTPELFYVVVIISSPLALLVALWGMTPKAMLRMMKSNEKNHAGEMNEREEML